MAATAVADANFDDEVLASTTPVLVDFWAQWCGPCRMMAPMIDEIASAHADTLRVPVGWQLEDRRAEVVAIRSTLAS